MTTKGSDVAERLEYLRGELRSMRLSWGELAELQGLAPFIEPGDVELLEAAGVPEFRNENDEDRGPNSSYEMFSREGNDACEALVTQLVADGNAGRLTRLTLNAAKETAVREVAEKHQEIHDTEPDGEICHQLNERLCKPLLWKEYGRWTG